MTYKDNHISYMRLETCTTCVTFNGSFAENDMCDISRNSVYFRVAKAHRMLYLYRSFSAKEPYD